MWPARAIVMTAPDRGAASRSPRGHFKSTRTPPFGTQPSSGPHASASIAVGIARQILARGFRREPAHYPIRVPHQHGRRAVRSACPCCRFSCRLYHMRYLPFMSFRLRDRSVTESRQVGSYGIDLFTQRTFARQKSFPRCSYCLAPNIPKLLPHRSISRLRRFGILPDRLGSRRRPSLVSTST